MDDRTEENPGWPEDELKRLARTPHDERLKERLDRARKPETEEADEAAK